MTIWDLLLLAVAVGVIWWLIDLAPFIGARLKPIMQYTLLVVVVFYVLNAIGLFDRLKSISVG